MVIMNLFRMMVDLSFYGAFVGLIAGACGGSGAFEGMMLQCLCFGLSVLGGKRRILRLVCLLPMVLCWVIHRSAPADGVLLIPTAVYIVWLVYKCDYVLDHERQQTLFGVFWKVLLAVVVFGTLLGGIDTVTAITIPYALVMLVCSVLLMRALRHEPRVYCQIRYQIVDLSAVAVVAAVAGLLSTNAVRNGFAAVLKAGYSTVIRPILEFLLKILLYIIEGFAALFSWLSFGRKGLEQQESPQIDLSGMEDILGKDIALREPGELLRMLGTIPLVAAAMVALILLFRWMSRRRGNEDAPMEHRERRDTVEVGRPIAKQKEVSPVRKIRAQYRGFLKWCSETGVQREQSSTSLDVHRQVSRISAQGAISEQIRELYIKARYAQMADRDSVRAMKRLCDQIKKPEED